MKKLYITLLILIVAAMAAQAASKKNADKNVKPVYELLNRVAPGHDHEFEFVIVPLEAGDSIARFFEIGPSANGKKVRIAANDRTSLASGLHWYLKHHTGNHLTWDNMTVSNLSSPLPIPATTERHNSTLPHTYYLNYCTHSYSMAHWDWERWQREIDWMALHGVNLPLALTGADTAWRNTLRRLGYDDDSINKYVAGGAFQAWWLMNNLEGWGGPNSPQWYERQSRLQQQIVERMRSLDISPVLPGYSGMVPADAGEKLGLDVADPGKWCGYDRPAFLQPADPRFDEIADIYYEELTKLYGPADYYAMDPFHEGGNTEGVDLTKAAATINAAMKRANPDAKWVVQAWQANPRKALLEGVDKGDMLILDLWSESRPQWGDPEGLPQFRGGYTRDHDFIFCMLLNFGGNVGLHGKMRTIPPAFARASGHPSLRGVGMTMEGIENNPVMYELMSELPWLSAPLDVDQWLSDYIDARYGNTVDKDNPIRKAWTLLSKTIYNCPRDVRQEGTTESIFCARPRLGAKSASTWAGSMPYYNADDVILAAQLFEKGYDALRPEERNASLDYDRIDILRQANAEKGRLLYNRMAAALQAGDAPTLRGAGKAFLDLILEQDSLLAAHPSFTLDNWREQARRAGADEAESRHLDRNAVVQVTTWGNRQASEQGGLHDYAHKEWAGLLRHYYYPRWAKWIDMNAAAIENDREPDPFDWYAFEESLINEIVK